MDRLTYDWNDWRNSGAEIAVTTTGEHVNVAVTQEKAVDSHNQDFTCAINLPVEEVEKVWRVLGEWLAKR